MSAPATKKAMAKRQAVPAASTLDVPACIHALERVLRGQLDGYTRLLAVIDRQREAIRTANPHALEQAAREQEALVRMLATIDVQATQLLGALQRSVGSGALGFREIPVPRRVGESDPALLQQARVESKDALTLSRLLERAEVDDEQRTRMLTLAADLRDKVQEAKRGGGSVRDAANALARHMAGIQQTVHSALSRARVYERRGRLNLGSAMPATVDLKS